jgi:acyl-coenzyme A synthetase/AMP-(fatty) acid ligase
VRVLNKLKQHAQAQPDTTAFSLVDRTGQMTQSLTYRQLSQSVAVAADEIRKTTPDGAVVIIQMPNCLAYPVAYLGVLAANRTVFPLHPALTPHEVAEAAAKAGAQWIISDGEAPVGVTQFPPKVVASWLSEQGNTPELPSGDAGTMLLQSSGTTGLPKIVERSADSIDAVAKNVADSVEYQPGDRVITAIPLCHSYGIENAVVGPLWSGATVCVCDGFDPDTVATQWADAKRAVFPAVPVMIDLLAAREGLPMPAGELIVYAAGATLPPDIATAFASRYGVHVGQLYGATEIGSVTFGRTDGGALPESCVGKPMAEVSIRILDLDHPGDHPPLAPGTEGQVAVSAPSMLSHYLGEQAAPMVDGHYLTGDLGHLNDNGALSITGRVKTLIEVGGMKVNPMEIEGVLTEHPAVAQCAIVPVRVTQTLSRVTAFYVPDDPQNPPDSAELRQFLKSRLAAYKLPRTFKPISELPRTSLGKVQRAVLSEATL